MQLTLNIGLNTPHGTRVRIPEALANLGALHFEVENYAVHPSSTESTLVVECDYRGAQPLRNSVHALAVRLSQDCIAVKGDTLAALYGPQPWGAFDPSQFLTVDGEVLADVLV